jgi:hypothetical protein
MKCVSALILVFFVLSGCGGGKSGNNVDSNVVAFCEDGTKYYGSCQDVCKGHGIVLTWGPKGQPCQNNPPPL